MEGGLTLPHAVALGLVQGATEPLPVSSSAHVGLLPWLLRWPEASLSRARRKELALALHAGTTLAALLAPRRDSPSGLLSLDRRRLALMALASGPAGIAGLLLERPVTRRLSSPGVAALGLAGGALASTLANRRRGRRAAAHATAQDALVIGLTQITALLPGVSRSGVTTAAALARGFSRQDARLLSEAAGLPVLRGASLLGVTRATRADAAWRRALALGAAASAAAAFVTHGVARRTGHERVPAVLALYRVALALLAVRRLRDNAPAMGSAA